ncbi:nucleoside triphosphate pyrophosphohydrolase [Methylobacterium durans]|uniref:Nucleoside triphosphate pyrophosphohydrolase n=1 Tax=Methylobacterium durans TaxID=2202825 RepID=A0A2U8WBS8_9HYPH|nr:nucleoside triphosphate pyrophosphohydrolase [Methylobacterium durans]AWN43533.1 nucleoside triphosphate pyrophosphohydrolase [Methylobacterium durans]
MPESPDDTPISRLLRLMAELRDPERGCAWDVAQTFASIVPYTLEEAYEVADAIARGDLDDLREELGDLLLQVVFHARMAEEAGAFGFDDVARTIAEKLVRRHPHVFDGQGRLLPDAERPGDPAEIEALWRAIKAEERAARGKGARAAGPLSGIAHALPALARAEKISRRAAGFGFDWPDAASVVAKVREETDEVTEALASGAPEAVAEEIGDLLFAVANLARHAGVDPEEALRRGNAKFERRFTAMAARLEAAGGSLPDSDLATMEAAWVVVKREEGAKGA